MLVFDLSNKLMETETAFARLRDAVKMVNEQMNAFDRSYQQLKSLEKLAEGKPVRSTREGEK